ncbi:RNA-directed DNA polymerase, eukaryota, reverse transcriptase zinc-binding domain protein [Tanacetum coccineum]
MSIKHAMGEYVEGSKIVNEFVNYFENFLGQTTPVQYLDSLGNIFTNTLTTEDAFAMVNDVSDQEIRTTMYSIDDCKAPGPDGYSACFFKKAWSVIGNDVCLAIKEFFKSGKLLWEVNSTMIVLIPKVHQPNLITEFRPIACYPNSRYLFTLVMEVFTVIMAKNVANSLIFKFHPGCKELKMTYLCFADDLLVICHKSVECVKVIKDSIDEFSRVSGLEPNLNKSTIFFGNVKIGDQRSILNVMPFKVGKFPVKYLGFPLITKRLGREEYKQLIDKVRNNVDDWKNKSLTYVGRMRLIAFVLNSMQVLCFFCQNLLSKILKGSLKVFYGVKVIWLKGKQRLLGRLCVSLNVKVV